MGNYNLCEKQISLFIFISLMGLGKQGRREEERYPSQVIPSNDHHYTEALWLLLMDPPNLEI